MPNNPNDRISTQHGDRQPHDERPAEDRAPASLSTRTAHGIGWNFAASACGFVLQLARAVVLARLLLPEDFGLVGIAAGTCFLLGVFTNLGLATALIQARRLYADCATSAFWLQLLVTAALMIPACLASPWVARFYGDPRLAPVLCWLAAGLTVQSALTVPLALMQRDLRFKEVNLMWGVLRVVSFSGAVAMALNGWSYWSLVVPDIVTRLAALPWLFWLRGWWPRPRWNWSQLRPILPFSGAAFLNRCLNSMNKHVDYVILGKFFAPQIFGLYYFAYKRSRVPAKLLGSSVRNALFPALSRRQTSPEAAHRAFRTGVPLYVVIVYWLATTLIVTMPQTVPLVFGRQWAEAVPMLQWFTVWLYAQPIHLFLSVYLTSLGRLSPMTYAHAARLVLTTVGLLVLAGRGSPLVHCAAWVAMVELAFAAIIMAAGFRTLKLPSQRVAAALIPGIGLAAVVATADLTLTNIAVETPLGGWQLLTLRLVVSLTSGGLFLAIFNRRLLAEAIKLMSLQVPARLADRPLLAPPTIGRSLDAN